MKPILLWFLIAIHWVIIFFSTFYIFFRTSAKYDTIYFITICTIIVLWMFTDPECIISYWEKQCLDESYVYGSSKNLPFSELVFGPLSPIVLIIVVVVTNYTLFQMLRLYKVPLTVAITMNIFYMQHIILDIIKNKKIEVAGTAI